MRFFRRIIALVTNLDELTTSKKAGSFVGITRLHKNRSPHLSGEIYNMSPTLDFPFKYTYFGVPGFSVVFVGHLADPDF